MASSGSVRRGGSGRGMKDGSMLRRVGYRMDAAFLVRKVTMDPWADGCLSSGRGMAGWSIAHPLCFCHILGFAHRHPAAVSRRFDWQVGHRQAQMGHGVPRDARLARFLHESAGTYLTNSRPVLNSFRHLCALMNDVKYSDTSCLSGFTPTMHALSILSKIFVFRSLCFAVVPLVARYIGQCCSPSSFSRAVAGRTRNR